MIRVFPRKTKWSPDDELAFFGEPPLYELPYKPVYISVTFSWDIDRAKELKKAWQKRLPHVYMGGPAIKNCNEPFEPGRFVKKGVTFTSRGCPKNCPWCLVRKREGRFREITIKPGHIIQDNNFLACSRVHIENVFEMLRYQGKAAIFSGGLDVDYLKEYHVNLFNSISVKELWFACDRPEDFARLDKVNEFFSDYPIRKKRCYVLCFFNGESLFEAEKRIQAIYEKGFLPFAQPYKSEDSPFEWCCGSDYKQRAEFIRKWQRPAAYISDNKENEIEEWLF